MAAVDNEISGRLALITGASGGIGAAVARDLYTNGAPLALTYSKNKDKLLALVTELSADPDHARKKISIHQVDVASDDDIARLFAEIKTSHDLDGPDIMFVNAGTLGFGQKANPYLENITIEEFDHTCSVNLRASFLLCKHAIPAMAARRWGRIVFNSSISAVGGGINGCHYAASKAGVTGMMKNLAYKHAKDGVTVNDVAPAMIGDTGMIPDETAVAGTPGDVRNIPVGRLGTPGEVANVVTMFCRTGYLTAQSILLSGGLK